MITSICMSVQICVCCNCAILCPHCGKFIGLAEVVQVQLIYIQQAAAFFNLPPPQVGRGANQPQPANPPDSADDEDQYLSSGTLLPQAGQASQIVSS